MKREKLHESFVQALLYIQKEDLSEKELSAIDAVLSTIRSGNVLTMISDKRIDDMVRINMMRSYLSEHPHDYLMIIGTSRIPHSQIIGVTKSYGIGREHVRTHTDYNKLRKKFPFEELQSDHVIGVISAEMPHSVQGLSGASSAIPLIPEITRCPDLCFVAKDRKLTKESLRDCLQKLIYKMTA